MGGLGAVDHSSEFGTHRTHHWPSLEPQRSRPSSGGWRERSFSGRGNVMVWIALGFALRKPSFIVQQTASLRIASLLCRFEIVLANSVGVKIYSAVLNFVVGVIAVQAGISIRAQ